MGHLTYDWKAKRALMEIMDSPTPNDTMRSEPDQVTRHCSKVGEASV